MFKNPFHSLGNDPILELVMSVSCISFYTHLVDDVHDVMFSRHIIHCYPPGIKHGNGKWTIRIGDFPS